MIRKKGQPITGTNTAMKTTRNVLTDAAHTSSDAEKLVKQPPMPFQNSQNQLNVSASSAAPGGVSTLEPKIASGLKRTTPGVKALPKGGAIGQNTMPNQSGQIGGRMSFPPPKRKAGNNASGYPSKRNASFYGE